MTEFDNDLEWLGIEKGQRVVHVFAPGKYGTVLDVCPGSFVVTVDWGKERIGAHDADYLRPLTPLETLADCAEDG